jgi:2-polyprenyl-3-methyl-5-hydroxy-6-metoxy-1,4-benzoquinol methylase
MTVAADPEGISARTIQEFVDLEGRRILEIGCGKGRLTFPLAEIANQIIAIDPGAEDIQHAVEATPDHLKGKIDFISKGIEEFEPQDSAPLFDLSIFTWSL